MRSPNLGQKGKLEIGKLFRARSLLSFTNIEGTRILSDSCLACVMIFIVFVPLNRLMTHSKLTIINTGKAVFFLCLLVTSLASANEGATKPFIKGSFEEIKQSQSNQAFIVTFWSESCGYCMEELTMFGRLLEQYPNTKLVSVTTDAFLEEETVNRILSSKRLSHAEKWVFADSYVARLYFDIDKKWRGELPLSYFFDKSGKMLKHLGTINEKELIEWLITQQ